MLMVKPLPVVRVYGEGIKAVEVGSLMVYRKWVKPPHGVEPGSLVVVESSGGDVLGCGFYDTLGPVALRLVEIGDCRFSSVEEVVTDRLEKAFRLRKRVGLAGPGRGYRLVHSDGDLLPGLIVDVYDELVVFQSSSIVWDVHREMLVKGLVEVLGSNITVYEKSVQRTRLDIGLKPFEKLWRKGSSWPRAVIEEGDAKFIVDPRLGQKTGFFLDQRNNRIEVEHLVEPDSKVLDLFSYTGGFGIHALLAGAGEAVFVEEDDKAVKILHENLRINRVQDKARVLRENVWNFLRTHRGEKFDFIVVDPPAFIPSRDAYRQGYEAYYHLYRHAASMIENGILFLSSCSTFLTRQDFANLLSRALSRRSYRLLGDIRGMPLDHPGRPSDPHLSYLKSAFIELM